MLARRTKCTVALLFTAIVTGVAPATFADDRSIMRWDAVVDAPLDELWDAWTTKAGIESWMVPLCEVDLRVGGTIKTNYDKDAGIGGPGTIVHHILSLEPKRMISMQFTAPENATVAKVAEATWATTRLDPVGPRRTRVMFTSCGWGEGDDWDKARAFFQKGNAWTLEKLRQKYAKPDAAERDAKALKLLQSLAGGEWIYENKRPDGGVFRVRNVSELGADGQCVVSRGWLGDADGMFFHSTSQIWREPASNGGGLRFQNVNEDGSVARGDIWLSADDTVTWDWNATSLKGDESHYAVTMQFADKDAYTFLLHSREADGTLKERVKVEMRRVETTPDEFKRLKPKAQ